MKKTFEQSTGCKFLDYVKTDADSVSAANPVDLQIGFMLAWNAMSKTNSVENVLVHLDAVDAEIR